MGVTTIVSYGVSQYLIGVLVPPIARDLGWDKAAINGAYSITVLVSGLSGFAVGRLADRFGARVLMSAGSALLGVSLLLLSRVQTLPEFYALWGAGIGLGTALTYYPISFTVVANWFDRRRMSALSLLTFFGAFASTVFYPLNGWLASTLGWRDAVAILGAVNLFVALPLHAFIIRRYPEDVGLVPDGGAIKGDDPAAPITGLRLSQALRTTAFWLITATISLSFFATTTVIVEHIDFLVSRGLPLTLVTTIVGLWGLAYLPGRTIVAFFGGKISLQVLIVATLLIEAAGVAILLGARDAWGAVGYVLVFGGAYGAIAPLRGAIMAENFGRRAYGSIISAQGIPIAVLSAMGPAVGGRIVDVIGYGASFKLCIATLIAGALLMLPKLRSPVAQ
ncbi:MAG: MFS transporter [Vulcanimicrobiaceae bacterium]